MSRAALATRPPEAPLHPNARQLTKQLQTSVYVRFEPDVVRVRPPPSGQGAPTLPAYLQPKRPPAGGPKPTPAPPTAKPEHDAKGGKDAKDKADKDKKADKDSQRKDGKAKDAQGGAGHRDPKAAAGAPGKGEAKGKKTAGGRGKAAGRDDDEAVAEDQLDAAVAETGGVDLERDEVRILDPSNSFDGPTALTARPQIKPGSAKEKPDPDVASYVAVFAEAAAAARRLHDALIADATNAAGAARSAASTSADRRQSELDRSLQSLDDDLADARQQLAGIAADAAMLVAQRATEAERAIRQAAAGARGALAKAHGDVLKGMSDAETSRKDANTKADGYKADVAAAAEKVGAGLETFRANPGATFPYKGDSMALASNEAIVTRAPKRAEHRIKAYHDEFTAQKAAMDKSFGRLKPAFDAAFQTVNSWAEKTATQGPAAVDQAAAASQKQLAAMRRQMVSAIRTGRARTDAALVRQHNAARAQTIAAHKTRAKSETIVESRRAEQDITGLRALAIAQGSSTRILADGFTNETDRGEKAFAKSVVTASRGFLGRVAAADIGQRPKLVASAANNRAVTERQSRSSGEGLVRSAEAVGIQLGGAAKDSGDGLFAQANDTSSSYDKLAQPVSKSIRAFMPPVKVTFDKEIAKLTKAASDTLATVDRYYNTGHANEPSGGGAEGGAEGGGAQGGGADGQAAGPAPKMYPVTYVTKAGAVAAKPETDPQIADLAVRAPPEIEKKIKTKSNAVWTHIGAFHVETDVVLEALRSITARQGKAIKDDFAHDHGDIEMFIRYNMPKTFSSPTTNNRNVDAAINYLNGNNVEGALNELKAAVNWSNENARVEAVARSLTPAQWAELKRLHPDELKDIREDLDGVNQDIFKALEKEGETVAAKTARPGESGIGDDAGKGVAEANALRLRDTIDKDREKRGDAGADKAADDVETMAKRAGSDVISGADPIEALEEHPIDAIDTADPMKERNKKQWDDTKQSFDKLELARKGGPAGPPEGAKAGWSIAAYAAQKRDYDVYVYDKESDPYGEYGHTETKTEGISDHQTRLIQNIVDYGPDSDEAAAARVMVELNRDGGKPKPERLDKAMHATDLDAREGENKSQLSKDPIQDAKLKKERLDAARERQQRVLGLVGQYQHPGVAGPWDPEAVRAQVKGQLTASVGGDDSKKALVERTMRGPADTWDNEQTERRKDARIAFDYALAHESERGDTLKRTFGRMDRDEIDASVKEWNQDPDHKDQKPLYEQLNLFGKGSWWTEKLSGDERNDVELAAMGVARDTKERAEIARFKAEQTIRDAGFLGKLAGKITGDWDRLVESRDKVEELMGLPHGSFDEMGRAKGLGNFDKEGNFKPPPGGSEAELEVAMSMTHLTAESYKVMTDSLATAVTTGLVVIAAVVTTVLTGGAAASIWVPMLITAGVTMAAGLTGMALSAAIKGNRYSRAEMERDLVVTIVQSLTAGLGAGAGVLIKGGMPAVKAVVSEAAIAEKALEGVAEAAARPALSKGATLVAEMGVQAGSNAINSAAAAAMDPATRARGESGDKAFEAGVKGLFSGAVGGLLTHGASAGAGSLGKRFGSEAISNYGGRVAGAVAGGVGQRGSEIGYDAYTGERRMEGAEVVEELKGAAAQAAIQSTLEHGAAHAAEGRRAAPGGGHPSGEVERPGARPGGEPEPRAASRQPQEAEPGPARPAGAAPVEPGARPPPAAEPIVLPFASDMAPVIGAAEKLRPPELPPIATSPVETPARPPEPEPVVPATRGPADEGDAKKKPPVGGRPADEDGPTTERMPRTGEKTPSGKPTTSAEIEEAGADVFEGGVMIPPNAKNRAEVDGIYHATINEDPSREVAIYRNPATGEHILVFGDQREAFIQSKRGGVDVFEAPMPGGSPRKQEFKDFLPADIGHWELEAHYHPTQVGKHDEAPMARRLPSAGAEGKGDFGVLRWESRRGGGQPRESVIHFFDKGRSVETVFGFDPKMSEPYSVNVENPATGKRESHRFADVGAYEKWASQFDVKPGADLAKGGGTPASRAARPDESFTIRHGTSEKAAENIARTGIDPHYQRGTADDFGRGFYTTLDEPNAGEYRMRGADQENRRNPTAAKPDVGAIIEINVKLSELGDVVDVRPGGEHHDAWQEFLDRKPPPSPPVPRLPYWETAREYGLNRGKFPLNEMQRGSVFEAFLQEKRLTEVDAIRGGLGIDNWTGGISAQPGEQIAIRSKRLANLLNERLGYPAIPDEPTVPRMRGGGTSGEEPPAPAPQPGRGRFNDLPDQGPNHPAVRDLADPFPEWTDPGGERPPPGTAAAKRARQEMSLAIDQRGIDRFIAARPVEGAMLKELLALAPEAVRYAIRGEPDPGAERMQRGASHRDALAEALAAKGLTPDEIARHVAALRDLLKTPRQQVSEYRNAVLGFTEDTPKAIKDWHERAETKTANEAQQPLEHLQAKMVSDFAEQLASSGGGVREFIFAAREFEAWKDRVPGLDTVVVGAAERQIRAKELTAYRRLRPTKGANPQREALRRLDETPAGKELATEILSKFTGEDSQHDALVAEWKTRRRLAGVDEAIINREAGNLREVLEHKELKGKFQKRLAPFQAAGVRSGSVEAMALADPVLLALAATSPDQFVDRVGAMMRHEAKARNEAIRLKRPYDTGDLGAANLRAEVDSDMGARVKSVASEATASFNVAKEMGLNIMKSDSTTKGQTNEGGIDIVAVKPTPKGEKRPDKVPVHLFDDKAVAEPLLGKVPALTENLAANLKSTAEEQLANLLAAKAQGTEPNPDHEAAIAQMLAAAKDIADIDRAKLPPPGSDDKYAPAYQQLAYADAVAAILKKHGITLHITSEYGQVMDLAPWLKRYGFLLWNTQLNLPGDDTPPPAPPPAPPPTPTPAPAAGP